MWRRRLADLSLLIAVAVIAALALAVHNPFPVFLHWWPF